MRWQSNYQRGKIMNNIDSSITHITPKDGNIFEDLGFEPREAAKIKIKAQLMCQISEWIKDKQLKQEEASALLHVTRPRSLSENRKPTTKKVNLDNFPPDFRQIEQLFFSNHAKTCLKLSSSHYGSYSRTGSLSIRCHARQIR